MSQLDERDELLHQKSLKALEQLDAHDAATPELLSHECGKNMVCKVCGALPINTFDAALDDVQAVQDALNGRTEVPPELFDGYAVWKALGDDSGISARNVAAVLDAVVRLIRSKR